MMTTEKMKQLLVSHDKLGYYNPTVFNINDSMGKINAFSALCESVGFTSSSVTMLQDGGFFAKISLSTEKNSAIACEILPSITVIFSSFGDMIAVERGDLLSKHTLDVVDSLATKAGFQLIHPHVLNESYTGIHSGIVTWWNRFFDYL
jgi:hypothetical protein